MSTENFPILIIEDKLNRVERRPNNKVSDLTTNKQIGGRKTQLWRAERTTNKKKTARWSDYKGLNTWVPAKSRPSSLTAKAWTWPFGPLKLCWADVCSHRTQNKKQKAPTVHSFLSFPDHLETLKAAVRIISTVHHANPERNRTRTFWL